MTSHNFDLRGVSVSHGTLKTDDLLCKFCNALEQLDPRRTQADVIHRASVLCSIGEDQWTNVQYDDACWFLEQLSDALNEHAPDGHYFGAHWGDSSDFGFWPSEEEEEEEGE